MSRRHARACPPDGHRWACGDHVLLHPPQGEACQELVTRMCLQCPLVEVLFVEARSGWVRLRAHEQWRGARVWWTAPEAYDPLSPPA
jgi:hypothetical protein